VKEKMKKGIKRETEKPHSEGKKNKEWKKDLKRREGMKKEWGQSKDRNLKE
jgi:hypothetical protein